MAMLLHYEPILRHRVKAIPLASCTDPFSACAVNTWAHLIKQDPSTAPTYPSCPHTGRAAVTSDAIQVSGHRCSHSMFTAYMLLEGISASICEDRILGQLDPAASQRYERDLISWYARYHEPVKQRSDPLCLIVLWHSIFMSLLADFHSLELAVGKEGPTAAATAMASLAQWSLATNTKRCLLHAFLLQKLLQSVPLGRVMAIHVPRCLFSAAVAWAAYLACTSRDGHDDALHGALWPSAEDLDSLPEMHILARDVAPEWLEAFSSESGSLTSIKANTLCVLADLLRQLGHWGIAQKFTRILTPLIHHEVDDSTNH
jgi:hypothetical protein